MAKQQDLFLILALCYISCASGLPTLATLRQCCELGTNHAASGLSCGEFKTPIAGIAQSDQPHCLNSFNVCCNKKYKEEQCSLGRNKALSGGNCVSLDSEFSKGCCDACELGVVSAKAGETCGAVLGFGPPYDDIFTDCCREAEKFTTTTTSTTTQTTIAIETTIVPIITTTQNLKPEELNSAAPPKEVTTAPMVLVEVCDMCAQLCYPFENANRCDCHKGYTLMKDGVSCKPNKRPSRCPKNNPCEHDCYDTGTSIQCTCRIGYTLADDKKSCLDVDECTLGIHKCAENETCVNYEGDYDCEDPDEIIDEGEIDCPKGFKFDADNKLCNDINECEFPLSCQRPKICVNTIGSFVCEGDDVPACPPGFFYKESILDCADVDECITGQNDCNRESQDCLNTIGNYTCTDKASKKTCPPGFKKNTLTDICEDVNECTETPEICNENEECFNEPGGHSCLPKLPIPTKPILIPTDRSTQPITTSTPPKITTLTTSTPKPLPTLVFLPPQTTTLLPLYSPIIPTTSTERVYPKEVSLPDQPKPLTPPPYKPPVVSNNRYNPFGPNYPVTNQPVSCSRGYKYSIQYGDCIDIDECIEDNPCDSNQDCYNKPGSFICNCKLGFTKDFQTGACVDINECQIGTHDCIDGQRCDNTIGSFICSRTAGCGTGYTLNYASGLCEDDDECALGTHNCNDLGPQFQCRNTLGSYRCQQIFFRTTTKPLQTTKFTMIQGHELKCFPGYFMNKQGQCEDIDECLSNPCRRGEKCINYNGLFKCVPALHCPNGYELNEEGDQCIDINECARDTHKCGNVKICKNAPGYYICQCPPGHKLDHNNECVDMDECQIYRGRICSVNGECINTIGSYTCHCKSGFQGNGTYCGDIDECSEQPNLCQQKCVNLYGSYRCSCDRGFILNPDNRTCSDIDECEKFKSRGLCIGQCNNVPGSYTCSCPEGYRIGSDGRTCQDIDECQQNPCAGPDEICFNMRGGYRCPSIRCPPGYVRDRDHKSRCTRGTQACNSQDTQCLQLPRFYSFHFVTMISNYFVQSKVDFFQMKGPTNSETHIEYQLELKNVICPPHVRRVDESYFMTTKHRKNIIVSIVKSIEGPQDIELHVHSTFYVNGAFFAKALAKIFVLVSPYPF